MKRCTKCEIEKLPDQFHRKTKNRDGLSSWCKVCKSRDNRSYYSCCNIAIGMFKESTIVLRKVIKCFDKFSKEQDGEVQDPILSFPR